MSEKKFDKFLDIFSRLCANLTDQTKLIVGIKDKCVENYNKVLEVSGRINEIFVRLLDINNKISRVEDKLDRCLTEDISQLGEDKMTRMLIYSPITDGGIPEFIYLNNKRISTEDAKSITIWFDKNSFPQIEVNR